MKPPEKFSDAIELAVNDLQLVLAEPTKYAVNMETWLRPKRDHEPCEVCFAGAVMAKTLGYGASSKVAVTPSLFGEEWKRIFFALDDICQGMLDSAVNEWPDGWKSDKAPDTIFFECEEFDPDYPGEFISTMEGLVLYLRSIGT